MITMFMIKMCITIAATGTGMAMSVAIVADYPGAARWVATIGLSLAALGMSGMLSEMRK